LTGGTLRQSMKRLKREQKGEGGEFTKMNDKVFPLEATGNQQTPIGGRGKKKKTGWTRSIEKDAQDPRRKKNLANRSSKLPGERGKQFWRSPSRNEKTEQKNSGAQGEATYSRAPHSMKIGRLYNLKNGSDSSRIGTKGVLGEAK